MPENNRQFSLALEALAELKTETPAHLPAGMAAAPTLSAVLAEIGPLPREALFLGVATDGLPVLLNLHDPMPGPILVTGDAGAGKTALLKTIAQSLSLTHSASEVKFGVITNHADEWGGLAASPQSLGIFPINQTTGEQFIQSLASWAHSTNKPSQSVLLLVDDLESVAAFDFDALQSLRWLLARGPARRVWPILTLNATRYGQVLSWIPVFRTRIFGRIRDARFAGALGAEVASGVSQLHAGVQFSLRENGGWLRFWLPAV